MSLTIVPVTWREACEFVAAYHRHNKPPRGCKWAIGAVADGQLHGVALCGRPVARYLDDGLTIEVNRTCTDGWPNANSALYAACWRIAAAMGYRKGITYTQGEETGASLTAAGWTKVAQLPARGSWAESSVALRHLRDPVGTGHMPRVVWEVVLWRISRWGRGAPTPPRVRHPRAVTHRLRTGAARTGRRRSPLTRCTSRRASGGICGMRQPTPSTGLYIKLTGLYEGTYVGSDNDASSERSRQLSAGC